MISLALATALTFAAAQANPTVQPRQAYSKCLGAFMKQSLEAKMAPEAFGAAVKSACAAQESAFRTASIAYDVKMGGSRAQAQEDADLQVEDYLASIEDSYRVHLEGGMTPQPESAPE